MAPARTTLGSTNIFLNQLWEQAAAQGITVLVSTGDNGSAGCDNDDTQYYAVGGQAVSGFASTPYNVAVGGTDFFYSSYNSGSQTTIAQPARNLLEPDPQQQHADGLALSAPSPSSPGTTASTA